jgi:hypothetical protein
MGGEQKESAYVSATHCDYDLIDKDGEGVR